MTSSYTPGPWVFAPDDPSQGYVYGEDGAGRVVAQLDQIDEHDAANAALIAAAPGLLQSLADAIDRGYFDPYRDDSEMEADEKRAAIEAVRKARGY